MLLLLLASSLAVLVPAARTFNQASNYLRERSALDAELASSADALCGNVSAIEGANAALIALYAECGPSVLLPPTAAALAGAAEAIVARQTFALADFQRRVLELQSRGFTSAAETSRLPPGPCGLPGLLVWRRSPPALVQHLRGEGGFRLSLGASRRPSWKFYNPRVQAL